MNSPNFKLRIEKQNPENIFLSKSFDLLQFLNIQEYEYFISLFKKPTLENLKNITSIFSFHSTSKSYSYFIEFLDLYSDSEAVKHLSSIMKEKHMIFDNKKFYKIDFHNIKSFNETTNNLLLDRNHYMVSNESRIAEKHADDILNNNTISSLDFKYINQQIVYMSKILWKIFRKIFYENKKSLDIGISMLEVVSDYVESLKKNIINENILSIYVSLRINSIISAVNNIKIKLCIDGIYDNLEQSVEKYLEDILFVKKYIWKYTSIDTCSRYVRNILELQNIYNFLNYKNNIFNIYLETIHEIQFKYYLINCHFKHLGFKSIDCFYLHRTIDSAEANLGALFFSKKQNKQALNYLHDIWRYSHDSYEEKIFDSFYPNFELLKF